MRITSSGYVGIGTTTPNATVQIDGNFRVINYVTTNKEVSLTTTLQDLLELGDRASYKITAAVGDGSGGGVAGYTVAYVTSSNDYVTQGDIDQKNGGLIVLSWKAANGTSTDSHTLQARTTSASTNEVTVVVETMSRYANGGQGTGNGQFTFLL